MCDLAEALGVSKFFLGWQCDEYKVPLIPLNNWADTSGYIGKQFMSLCPNTKIILMLVS